MSEFAHFIPLVMLDKANILFSIAQTEHIKLISPQAAQLSIFI